MTFGQVKHHTLCILKHKTIQTVIKISNKYFSLISKATLKEEMIVKDVKNCNKQSQRHLSSNRLTRCNPLTFLFSKLFIEKSRETNLVQKINWDFIKALVPLCTIVRWVMEFLKHGQ